MDMFVIGTATTKHLPDGAKYFTWDDFKPKPRARYICLSRYGVARIGEPIETFDIAYFKNRQDYYKYIFTYDETSPSCLRWAITKYTGEFYKTVAVEAESPAGHFPVKPTQQTGILYGMV